MGMMAAKESVLVAPVGCGSKPTTPSVVFFLKVIFLRLVRSALNNYGEMN